MVPSRLASQIDSLTGAAGLAKIRTGNAVGGLLSRGVVSAGAVAQLGERCVRNAEVEGSTPFRST